MEKKTISDSKFVVPLSGSVDEVKKQVEASLYLAHYFEARFDLLSQEAKAYIKTLQTPLIITLKPDELASLQTQYHEALTFNPEWIDIDYKWAEKAAFITTPVILSSHEGKSFKQVKAKLEQAATHFKGPLIMKIALASWSPLELFEILALLKAANLDGMRLLILFRGSQGRFMRLITPLMTPQLSFIAADEISRTDPGQITLEELETTYKPFKPLQPLPIYALLGKPTAQSRGPLFHNQRFIERGIKGLYVAIDLEKEQALTFVEKATSSKLFHGFSITMPYKTTFAPITKTDEPINTLAYKQGNWQAVNTDGQAAIELIKEHLNVQNAHIVILGTGGTAKAIANAAKEEGMQVTLISRSKKEVEGFLVETYEKLDSLDYDVLVQATPAGFKGQKGSVELKNAYFLKGKCFLECVQEETEFIHQALAHQGQVIRGSELFKRQAILQSLLWQNGQKPLSSVY